MKKIYIAVVVLAMLFALSVSALAQVSLTVGEAELEQSEGKATVELPITLSGNTGLTGLKFKVNFTKGLEVKKVTKSEAALTNLDMTVPGSLASSFSLMWDGIDADNTNGEIALLTVEVSKEVAAQYDIKVTLEEAYDYDLNDVAIVTANGKVTVKGDKVVEPEAEEPKAEEPKEEPKVEEPKVEEPKVEEPKVEEPKNEDVVEVYLMAFKDVSEKDWFYNSVKFVSQKKLMNGVGTDEFAPNSSLTRAMLVTILYRMENQPECKAADFKDVEKGMWYTDSISWAYENKIVSGVGDGKFAPNANITREQIAVILYNYAKYKNAAADKATELDGFTDSSAVSSWATDAVKWAVGTGIITGKTETTIVPQGQATRAEAATMLMRYLNLK